MTSDLDRAIELRQAVINVGPFRSLASAAAYEINDREVRGLPRTIPELDLPRWVVYPNPLSLWWAVDEMSRPSVEDQRSDPDAGRNPAPREEHDMADAAAPNPLNRLKADPERLVDLSGYREVTSQAMSGEAARGR